ncbi:ferroxidase fet3 [Coemansia sp. IMI 203386]|nr:ferroxidase fet3 [Coemansia sp. IMI 203386]
MVAIWSCWALAAFAVQTQASRVEYNWSISNAKVKMDKINERQTVVVNGQYPMPVAIAEMGDTLVLNLHNQLDEPTGLHSHGILNNGTNYYDGAGMVTECGVAPNSRFTYEIPLYQTGTYWLHGHHNSQYINGLRGPLIVTDPNGEPYDYDEDIVLTFEDWFHKPSTMKMDPMPHAEIPDFRILKETESCQEKEGSDTGSASLLSNNVNMAQSQHMEDSIKHKDDPAQKYPLSVINGLNGDDAPDLNFEAGKTYRIRLLNIGSTSMFRFALEGHDMYVIEADGVSTEMKKVDSVTLGVAQRVSVLVKARSSGDTNYRYHFEGFTDVFPRLDGFNPRKHLGSVVYDRDAEYGKMERIVWDEFDDLALVPLEKVPVLKPTVVHDLVVSADRTSTDLVHAFINGISFGLPQMPSIFTAMNETAMRVSSADFGHQCNAKVLQHLDIVELVVMNTDTVYHPMHLHGHFFQIVQRGTIGDETGVRNSSETPMRRDTILVGPNQFAVLRFVADNPGVWLMHCHIERHMELGLSMMFVSAPDVMRETMRVPEAMKQQCRLMGIHV